MKKIRMILGGLCCLMIQPVFAHGPLPVPLQGVPIPPVPGLLDGPDPIVVNKDMAVALGKALFWDMNVGSDGMACGSCHFHAGADSRIKNQLNPGDKSIHASGQAFDQLASGAGGPNHTLNKADFPLHQYNDPFNKASGVISTTDDVVASSGTFSGEFTGSSRFSGNSDECNRNSDPVFHVNSMGTRRVEPRNAPTVINAVFNHRNFWDGRANNVFNGSSSWGDRDPDAGVWVRVNSRQVVKQKLHLENSSLASLATAPPLSDSEMGCRNRTWPDVGRKLLLRQPLQHQKVHYEDSVFGPLNLTLSSAGDLQKGLKTTYKNMIRRAFNNKYWAYTRLGPFSGPDGQMPYNQMEANFAMFFGIALQMYQATLVSDQAPIDLSPRDPIAYHPNWTGMGKTAEEIESLKNGFDLFVANHCNICHAGPLMTTAAITTNSALVTQTPGQFFGPEHSPRAFGPDALAPDNGARFAGISPFGNVVTRDIVRAGSRLMDLGFANTGVGDPDADPGQLATDDFGNPLSFSAQYIQYLLDNSQGVKDAEVNKTRACDFIDPIAFNSEFNSDVYYSALDDIVPDGSREGEVRNQNCLNADLFAGLDAFIPSPDTVAANLDSPKLAVATKAGFKIPTLRNIELTGPYMHNGSMASLEQVVQFYSRFGNFDNDNMHNLIDSIILKGVPGQEATAIKNRADLIAFLKTFTDERVRFEKAPFDHPELIVPHGHSGDDQFVTAGNSLEAGLAADEAIIIPAVGASGSVAPVLPFEDLLAP